MSTCVSWPTRQAEPNRFGQIDSAAGPWRNPPMGFMERALTPNSTKPKLKKDFYMSNLKNELAQFTGGTMHHFVLPLFPQYRYTDGVQYLAENAACLWLLIDIFAYQNTEALQVYRKSDPSFQVWILEQEKQASEVLDSAFLICEDGNNNEIFRHHYSFTDFPLDRIELWLERNLLILPGEH